MAIQKPKPYTITWPFTPKTADDIDQTFDILFKQVEINAPSAGVLPVSLGGTGLGSFVKGDLLYASTASTIAGLSDIATGNVLLSGGVNTAPSYGKVGLTTHVSGVLPEANGGTDQSTYAQGDILYASATDTLAKLAKDANATRYLSNTGASNGPAWAQVNLANGVTGTLPVANGGTNIASYTAGDMLYATGATTLAKLGIGAANRVLRSDGSAPNWGQVSDAYISDVTEAKITDGSILARVAAIETITGNWIVEGDWTFSGTPVFTDGISVVATSAIVKFIDTGGGTNEQRWRFLANSETFALQALTDNEATANSVFSVTRSGATVSAVSFGASVSVTGSVTGSTGLVAGNGTTSVGVTINAGAASIAGVGFQVAGAADGSLFHFNGDAYWDTPGSLFVRTANGATTRLTLSSTGDLTIPASVRFSGIQNVTLSTGNNNDVSLSAGTVLLRVTTSSGAANTLTGLTGGTAGRLLFICAVSGGEVLDVTNQDTNSTAANRFICGAGFTITVANGGAFFIYDSTSSRWRLVAYAV